MSKCPNCGIDKEKLKEDLIELMMLSRNRITFLEEELDRKIELFKSI